MYVTKSDPEPVPHKMTLKQQVVKITKCKSQNIDQNKTKRNISKQL